MNQDFLNFQELSRPDHVSYFEVYFFLKFEIFIPGMQFDNSK